MRTVPMIAVLLIAAFAAVALWYGRQHPRVVVATGSITTTSKRTPFQALTLATRDVEINGVRFREVELPGGTWIDCAGDCLLAVRNAREDFWDKQEPPRK
jgi:hypothetical protein